MPIFFSILFSVPNWKKRHVHSIGNYVVPDDCKEHVTDRELSSLVYIQDRQNQRLCDGVIKYNDLTRAVFLTKCIAKKVKNDSINGYSEYSIAVHSIANPTCLKKCFISSITDPIDTTVEGYDIWKPFTTVFVSGYM